MRQLVVFSLGAESYAVPIMQVQEIIRYTPPRAIPSTAADVLGVINLRGRIITVCDLHAVLGLPSATDHADAKIVVVETAAQTSAFVVSDVDEVLTVTDEQIEPAGADATSAVSCLAKVGDRLLVVLDLDALGGSSDPLELAA